MFTTLVRRSECASTCFVTVMSLYDGSHLIILGHIKQLSGCSKIELYAHCY